MNSGRRNPLLRRAFTLMEALVAVVIAGIGVASAMAAIGSLTRAQVNMTQKELMQRLALEKYEELVASGDYTVSSNGDFSDRYEDRYEWESEVVSSGVENLDQLVVRVFPVQGDSSREELVSGLIFTPPLESAPEEGGGTQ